MEIVDLDWGDLEVMLGVVGDGEAGEELARGD